MVRYTLRDVHGFLQSFVAVSNLGKELIHGTKYDQAAFLYYSTLQFYYEFNVKLKQSLEEVNKDLGSNWKLKMNMKTNQLRIAEKIQ